MLVGELIDLLRTLDKDKEILIWNDKKVKFSTDIKVAEKLAVKYQLRREDSTLKKCYHIYGWNGESDHREVSQIAIDREVAEPTNESAYELKII